MRKKKVLVVDDNADNRYILNYRLYQLGEWDILEAENGQQALELVEREQLDLVFMDLRMPVLDGWEAIRRIRALGTPMRDVPIITLTAQPPESEETAVRATGCDAYLTKPVNKRVIRKTIEALLAKESDNRQAGEKVTATLTVPGGPYVLTADEPYLVRRRYGRYYFIAELIPDEDPARIKVGVYDAVTHTNLVELSTDSEAKASNIWHEMWVAVENG